MHAIDNIMSVHMNYTFILAILVTGLSGIVAQVVLLRELLISFLGNELTLGIILANWLVSEALGVYAIGMLIDRVKNKINVFIILQIAFSITLPISLYLSRVFKNIIGISAGETVGLPIIFLFSFLVIIIPAFCHAALFSCACQIVSSYNKETARSIGTTYTVETAGTLVGGLLLTYLFLPNLNSFQTVFFISLTNFFVCIMLFKYSRNKILHYSTLIFFLITVFLFMRQDVNALHYFSIKKQFMPNRVLDYRNSVYGNVTVTKKENQYTFFYNGLPEITTPFPNITFVEEFGNLPLLFHPAPSGVLVISGGAGGLLNEILKHPVKKIDYVELDPLVIAMIKKFPAEITQRELTDTRVNIINEDGRFFLHHSPAHYDVALIGVSNLSDLTTNRFFTQEFFFLVKQKLQPKGILAFFLPGSLAYLSPELKDINSCVESAAKKNFRFVRVIPGDYNIFLSSDAKVVMETTSSLIGKRMEMRNIKTNILVPAYLDYRLDNSWVDWFTQSMAGATLKTNLDTKPLAVFETLILWNKQFSVPMAHALKKLSNFNMPGIFLLILCVTVVLFSVFYLNPKVATLSIAYSIATTGFYGMLISLILIFIFQVRYGYVYHVIGLLMSIFMAGSSLGSLSMTHYRAQYKKDVNFFILLEVLTIIFSCICALITIKFLGYSRYSYLLFLVLFLALGIIVGMEFPLAARVYLKQKERIGQTAGLLYFSDLLGGCVAGIIGGILFLPILGLFNAFIVTVLLKLSSVFLLLYFKKITSL